MVSTMMTTTTTTNKRCSSSSTSANSSHHKISTAEIRERLRQTTTTPTSTRRSKKIVMKKKDGSLALVNKDKETKQERKLSVQDCLSKYDAEEGEELSLRNIIKALPPNPYDDDDQNNNNKNNNNNKPESIATLGTSGSMSLQGSIEPLTSSQQKLDIDASCSTHTAFERRCNSSLDLSLDLSSHRRYSTSNGATSGGGGGGDGCDIISTSASEEQWARFKLLGRTGLGEIDVSANKALQQLIDRNFDILKRALKNIVAIRDDNMTTTTSCTRQSDHDHDHYENNNNKPFSMRNMNIKTGHLLDEVRETIDFSTATLAAELKRDPDTVKLKPQVEEQLRDYITVISAMYRNNPFHNFEHASTVLFNVNKLMGLVVKRPDDMSDIDDITKYGCGVTNDPWIQFALVFSALVHDVDHAGVSNAQLIKEKSLVAGAYKNRSVAEQNSIELAWNLLLEPCYKEFRETIFMTPSECSRFRGLVVTAVMATDIADKELAKLRKDRAAEVLDTNPSKNNNNSESDNDNNSSSCSNNNDDGDPDEVAATKKSKLISRKATYVVETLIQAADISHTMQSFAMYKKWNQKLFREMYDAYKSGRAEKDPSEFWFNGEFGFFDFYIVPLCNKLKDCGIFEKASEDYIHNAKNNRKAWEELGENLVSGYLKEYDQKEEEQQQQQQTKEKKKKMKKRTIDYESSSEEEEDVFESEETVNKVADNHRNVGRLSCCDSSTESPLDTDFESFGANSDCESFTPGLDDKAEMMVSHTPKGIMRGNKADNLKNNHRHASKEGPPPTPKKMSSTKPQAKAKRVRKKGVASATEPSSAAVIGGGRKKERSKSFEKDAISVGDGEIFTGKVRRVRSKSADPETLKRRSRSKSVDKASVAEKPVRRGSCGSGASSGAEKEKKKGKKVRRGSCSSGCSSGGEKELKKGKKVPATIRGREVKKVSDRGRKVVRSKSRDAASGVAKTSSTSTKKTTTRKQRTRSNEVELKSRNATTTSKDADTDEANSIASGEMTPGKKIRRRSKSLEPSDLIAENKKKERRGCKKPKPKIKKLARVAAVQ